MGSNDRRWSPRPFRDGDEERILELGKVVYPQRQDDRDQWMKGWQWVYRDNPGGEGKIWLAEQDGRLVGLYAMAYRRMTVGGQSAAGAVTSDVMTHPAYRRQGISEELAKAALSEAQRDGVGIAYAFPNRLSYPLFVTRLNWFQVNTMRALVKPLDWRNALKLLTGNRLLLTLGAVGGNFMRRAFFGGVKTPVIEGLTITEVHSFDERVNHLWVKTSRKHRIMVDRDSKYLNWRYVSAPVADYIIYVAEQGAEVAGYLVLRCMGMNQTRVAIIFDVVAQSEGIAHCLIAEAIERSRQEKVDLLYYASIGGSWVGQVFRRNGFLLLPFVKRMRCCAYLNSSDISEALLQNPENWFLQMGDTDTL